LTERNIIETILHKAKDF